MFKVPRHPLEVQADYFEQFGPIVSEKMWPERVLLWGGPGHGREVRVGNWNRGCVLVRSEDGDDRSPLCHYKPDPDCLQNIYFFRDMGR